MRLYAATSNAGKLREFRLAAGARWEIVPLEGVAPCAETGATFAENAIGKARHYGAHAAGLLFADDSGLEVEALGGAPGVLSARFAGADAADATNNRLLIERLRGVDNRSARFVSVIALADRGTLVRTFAGSVGGWIVNEPRGSHGFGYDPYFFYPPFGLTFAEMDPEQKFLVSHRGRAMAAMMRWLPEFVRSAR